MCGLIQQGRQRMLAIRLAAVALIASMPIFVAVAQEPGIHGTWWTKGKQGRVEITDCAPPAKGVCGKIVWISKPNDAKGRPQTDTANGNPKLRSRPIVGLQLFEGWSETGPKKWRGSIYDPDRGSNFNVTIALAGDRLVVTGCIAWGCESETWTRYRD
jgi:uncharacterized protein (DUF2147 family)